MDEKAKLHCLKAARLTRKNNLHMSYSSHVESIFWLLHSILVEAVGSQNLLVELCKEIIWRQL